MMTLFETISEEEFLGSGTVPCGSVPATPDEADTRITKGVSSAVPEVLTFDCEYCGHCETPNECAWSRVCAVCSAEPRDHCKTPTGGISSLHAERWAA